MNNTDTPILGETPEQADIRLNKDVAAFSYVWIMSVVVFAARKNSPFAQHHSKQGMILFLMSFVWIVPWVGQYLAIIVAAGMVLGFIQAAQGQKADVPIVGPLSRGELKMRALFDSLLSTLKSIPSLFSHLFHSSKTEKSTKAPPATPVSEAPPLDTAPGNEVQ